MWNKIKQNLVFRFLSSVRLAVPLLVVVASAILAGTITESRYNAEYAKMVVYDTPWFIGLFFLLAVNITFAALSRIPYKKIHTGFVITHVGMIVLMIGSWMTYQDGIDGSLSVQEKTSSSSVVLNERVFEMVGQSFFKKMLIQKTASMKNQQDLREINDQFIGLIEIEKYYPFVKPAETANRSSGPGIAFSIKNSFFDENLFLDLDQQREVNLGPATFRLIPFGAQGFQEEVWAPSKPKRKPSQVDQVEKEEVVIKDVKTQKIIKKVSLNDLTKGISLNNFSIKIIRKLKNGVVVQNKIAEGDGGSNPVLEIEISQGTKAFREIVYAKFPDFALTNNPGMPFKFIYLTPLVEETSPSGAHGSQADAAEVQAPKDHNHASAPAMASEGGPGNGSNIVEFQLLESLEGYQQKIAKGEKPKVKVLLIKKNKVVMSKEMSLLDKVETPWMGMTLTLNDLKVEAAAPQSTDPEIFEAPPLFSNTLPPSALLVRVKDMAKPVWLVEGQVQEVTIEGEPYQLYFGRNILQIPFKVNLDKFSKKDYLGTEMAMSFQSSVRINSEKESTIISMNEPLKRDGYTLYQSSYQMQPNAPAISIFSVNKDPGRPVKYLGSLIMAIGIIIYTLMRSRYYRKS